MTSLHQSTVSYSLLADAAIASWHAGDRKTCLQDFVAVLTKMQSFEPDESLRAANCHANARHVLLWLDHDATGKDFLLDGGESARIFPGCVSNPDPNKDVTSKPLLPIEMAWYMLATIENNALLNVGITENIGRFLPKGPLIEGQMFLISAKMHSALARLDNALFVDALQDKIAYYAYVQSKGAESPDDGIQFNYGQIPAATKEQQIALIELAEQLVLLYSANSILRNEVGEISSLVPKIFGSSSFTVRPDFLNRLQCDGPTEDFYMQSAKLIFLEILVLKGNDQGTPHQAFELAFKILQIAHGTRNLKLFAENLIPWLRQRWDFVWDRQRFLLRDPELHGDAIKAAFEQEDVPAQKKVVEILSSMLPTLGHGNQSELERILGALPKQ